jgi:polyhydroxyalkanoate synthesis repressor PhaR
MTTVIKKYSNRRLYDTDESRYITLEELTDRVRGGKDVRVLDAKTGEDLTQATLTQIILETDAAKLLPVPLLARLIRMQDDALGDFFSKYVSAALEMYLAAKQGAQAMAPYFPFATMPFSAGNALARALSGAPVWPDASGFPPQYPQPAPYATPVPAPPPSDPDRSDVAALRSELQELRRELRSKKPARKARGS